MQSGTGTKQSVANRLGRMVLAVGIVTTGLIVGQVLSAGGHTPAAVHSTATVTSDADRADALHEMLASEAPARALEASALDRADRLAQQRTDTWALMSDAAVISADRADTVARFQGTPSEPSGSLVASLDKAQVIAQLDSNPTALARERAATRSNWIRLTHRFWTPEVQARLMTGR